MNHLISCIVPVYNGERYIEEALDSILAQVAGYGVHHVTVTGGEPLAQRPCLELLRHLCDAGQDHPNR